MIHFRQAALDKQDSFHRYEELLSIHAPLNNLALVVLVILVITLVAWLFYGSISSKATGQGILVGKNGHLHQAVAKESGVVKTILVKPGDTVKVNQPLVLLSRPDLKLNIQLVARELNLLEQELKITNQNYHKDSKIKENYLEKQERSLNEIIQLRQSFLDEFKNSINDRVDISNKGLISKIMLENQILTQQSTIESFNNNVNALIKNKIDFIENENKWSQQIINLEQKVLAKKIVLKTMQQKYAVATTIRSPISGMVTSIKTTLGDYVKPAHPLVSLSVNNNILDALVFGISISGNYR